MNNDQRHNARLTGRLVITGIGAAALAIYLTYFLGLVNLSPDTTTYYTWHPWIPLGYPLFLSAVEHTVGLRWTGTIQVALLASAITLVGLAIERLTGRWMVGAFATVVLFFYTPIFSTEAGLLSESLYSPLLLANTGCAFLLMPGPSRAAAIGVAFTAVAAMFVRPAGYFMLLGPVFLLMVYRGQWRWMCAWLIAPLLIALLGMSAINFFVRGNGSQSQVGRPLFPHVAFLFEPAFLPAEQREYAEAIDRAIAQRRIEYLASDNPVRYSANDFNRRLDAMDAAVQQVCKSQTGKHCPFAVLDRLYVDAFLATVRRKPVAYLSMVTDVLMEAWSPSTMLVPGRRFNEEYRQTATDPAQAALLRSYRLPLTLEDITARLRPTPTFIERAVDFIDDWRIKLTLKSRWLIFLVGAASALAAVLALVWSRFAALGYCGVLIHGSMLLVAATTAFIPRYALPIDPILLIAGVLMADAVLVFFRQKIAALRQASASRATS